jgi:hypothetical protein
MGLQYAVVAHRGLVLQLVRAALTRQLMSILITVAVEGWRALPVFSSSSHMRSRVFLPSCHMRSFYCRACTKRHKPWCCCQHTWLQLMPLCTPGSTTVAEQQQVAIALRREFAHIKCMPCACLQGWHTSPDKLCKNACQAGKAHKAVCALLCSCHCADNASKQCCRLTICCCYP